jgi:hypothetical protein
MIEAHGLTKRYGAETAVDELSFTSERPLGSPVRPGKVTPLKVLRSEWTGLRTMISTSITPRIAGEAKGGPGTLVSRLRALPLNTRDRASRDRGQPRRVPARAAGRRVPGVLMTTASSPPSLRCSASPWAPSSEAPRKHCFRPAGRPLDRSVTVAGHAATLLARATWLLMRRDT